MYGTFARLIERYVRGEGTLSLTEAVHKVTGQPAERFRLAGKGVIAPGADADLCLFDAANIRERDSYEHPDSLAAGMDYVFVRGVLAHSGGRVHRHGERPGDNRIGGAPVLRGPGDMV